MARENAKSNRELFRGAAQYYARFRKGYPKGFFEYVIKYFQLDGKGRLLDLGCGTGQIAIPLAPYFEEVVGLDIDKDMLEEAGKQAVSKGIKNIKWILGNAEDASKGLGIFRLAVFGASFHWVEQKRTLAKLYEILDKDGGLVIVGGSSSIWRNPEKEPWKERCKEVVQKYLGEKRRAGNSYYVEPKGKFEDIVAASKFGNPEKWTYNHERKKNIDDIIGLLYTTSFAQRRFFGGRVGDFERELRNELLKINPRGEFTEKVKTEALLAHKF